VSDYHNQCAGTFHNWAALMERRGETAEARRLAELAIREQRIARQLNPKHPGYRDNLNLHLILLAKAQLVLGQHGEAAEAAAELVKEFPEFPERSLDAVVLWLQCASVAEKDLQMAPRKRQERARAYADRAMSLLQRLVPLGYRDGKFLRESTELERVRPRTEFQQLLREIDQQAHQEPK
jgi:hypothetical protein